MEADEAGTRLSAGVTFSAGDDELSSGRQGSLSTGEDVPTSRGSSVRRRTRGKSLLESLHVAMSPTTPSPDVIDRDMVVSPSVAITSVKPPRKELPLTNPDDEEQPRRKEPPSVASESCVFVDTAAEDDVVHTPRRHSSRRMLQTGSVSSSSLSALRSANDTDVLIKPSDFRGTSANDGSGTHSTAMNHQPPKAAPTDLRTLTATDSLVGDVASRSTVRIPSPSEPITAENAAQVVSKMEALKIVDEPVLASPEPAKSAAEDLVDHVEAGGDRGRFGPHATATLEASVEQSTVRSARSPSPSPRHTARHRHSVHRPKTVTDTAATARLRSSAPSRSARTVKWSPEPTSLSAIYERGGSSLRQRTAPPGARHQPAPPAVDERSNGRATLTLPALKARDAASLSHPNSGKRRSSSRGRESTLRTRQLFQMVYGQSVRSVYSARTESSLRPPWETSVTPLPRTERTRSRSAPRKPFGSRAISYLDDDVQNARRRGRPMHYAHTSTGTADTLSGSAGPSSTLGITLSSSPRLARSRDTGIGSPLRSSSDRVLRSSRSGRPVTMMADDAVDWSQSSLLLRGAALPAPGTSYADSCEAVRHLWKELHVPQTVQDAFAAAYFSKETPENHWQVLQQVTKMLMYRQLVLRILELIRARENLLARYDRDASLNAVVEGSTMRAGSEDSDRLREITGQLRQAFSQWQSDFNGVGCFVYNGRDYIDEVARVRL